MPSGSGNRTRSSSHSPDASALSFLEQQVWDHGAGGVGTEMRVTLAAMAGGFRLGQTFLGTKQHLDRGSADLVLAMRQTVGTLFSSLEPNFPTLEYKPRDGAYPHIWR